MEEVVPWVPYLFDTNVDIISENVEFYSFDQFAGSRRSTRWRCPGTRTELALSSI